MEQYLITRRRERGRKPINLDTALFIHLTIQMSGKALNQSSLSATYCFITDAFQQKSLRYSTCGLCMVLGLHCDHQMDVVMSLDITWPSESASTRNSKIMYFTMAILTSISFRTLKRSISQTVQFSHESAEKQTHTHRRDRFYTLNHEIERKYVPNSAL